jgi:hypothetical protein
MTEFGRIDESLLVGGAFALSVPTADIWWEDDLTSESWQSFTLRWFHDIIFLEPLLALVVAECQRCMQNEFFFAEWKGCVKHPQPNGRFRI